MQDRDATTRTSVDLALSHYGRGDYDGASRAYRRAVHLARQEGDKELGVRLLRLSALFYAPRRAVREITRALEEARRHGIEQEIAFCHNDRGVALLTLQGVEPARADFQRSAQILERSGEARNGAPWSNLGLLEILCGLPEEADGLFREALSRGGEPSVAASVRCNQAILRAMRGDAGTAAAFGEIAGEVERTGDPALRSRIVHNQARALLLSGNPEEAWREAMACPVERHLINDELIEGRKARLLLDVAEALGREPLKAGEVERLRAQARTLETSIHPQAWFFRGPWAYCEVVFR
jgi:tetratricopeptide (TPR) repeat protein